MSDLIPTIKPTYKQHLAYEKLQDNVTRFITFGGGAEGGKTWLGAEWLTTNCYFYPGSKWFLGRNELTRLMGSSFQSFLKVGEHHKIPRTDWKFNGQYHYIEFFNGSRIDLIDLKQLPTDPMFQRFGSYEYTGGWIEEAGEVPFMAFDMLKTRVGRWRNDEFGLTVPKILLTCNPEQNWLYRIVYKPWKKKLLPPGYAFIQALYQDNPYTAEQAAIRLDLITDPVMRKRLKLGLWEYNVGDNSLVNYDSIIDLFTNTISEDPLTQFRPQERYFTADVARYGSDRITFGNWKGLELYKVKWKKNRGIDQTAQDIKDELRAEMIPYSHTVADDDGVGGGVVDIARGIKGFVGNSKAIDQPDKNAKGGIRKENYKNLRSQCGFMLADSIMSHKMSVSAELDEPTKEMIIEDLQALLKKKDTPIESPLQLIPKEEIKEALGRSPDFADMMLMRMLFELKRNESTPYVYRPAGGIKPLYPGMPG